MKIAHLNSDDRVIVIAEIGNNHGGDADRARRMIDLAHNAGADAVKFQTMRPAHYVSRPLNEERFRNLSRWALTYEDFAMLAAHAADIGVAFLSTPFDLQSARFLGADTNVSALKIASGDNTFFPLIAEAAGQGKPLIISTGILDEIGITAAIDVARSAIKVAGTSAGITLMHCVCAYPVPPEEANIAAVAAIAKTFPDCAPGYSDHTNNNRASQLAILNGARVIERHFTDDQNSTEGPDHKISADPGMMRDLVRCLRKAEETGITMAAGDATLLGDGILGCREIETAIAPLVRRSIAAATDLTAGHALGADDITWVRPGTGFAPGNEIHVIGRRLREAVVQGTIIQEALLSH